MKKKRVTMQDIADELGISRNTVSKAINNTGSISAKAKNMVFRKAKELGYKEFSLFVSSQTELKINHDREIALFTCSIPGTQHLSSTLLDSFQKKISQYGYRLTIYLLRESVISECSLPENFNAKNTDGILVLELFNKKYTDFLCSQNIPTLFVDSYANAVYENIPSDIMYVESKNSSFCMVNHLLDNGCEKIGFVGDYLHCQSFFDRWNAFSDAMKRRRHMDFEKYSITDSDSSPYGDDSWLAKRIMELEEIPDAFFCANDFLAVCIIKALKKLPPVFSRPSIKVTGFDNSPESRIIDPALTTATIYGHEMGYLATDILLRRIKYPEIPYTTTYSATDIVYRDSSK